MELLGEEEYNPGVPVWRGEPQVRRIISMLSRVMISTSIFILFYSGSVLE